MICLNKFKLSVTDLNGDQIKAIHPSILSSQDTCFNELFIKNMSLNIVHIRGRNIHPSSAMSSLQKLLAGRW